MPAASPAYDRITCHATVLRGQPVVRGLADYPVTLVLELLAAGMTEAQVLAAHPALEPDDFRACYAYAAERLKPQPPPPRTEEELRDPAQWMSPAQFKAYLQSIGKLPPDAEPAAE